MKKRWLGAFCAMILVLVLLTGCGNSAATLEGSKEMVANGAQEEIAIPSKANSGNTAADSKEGKNANERKIVHTGNLCLTTKQYAEDYQALLAAIEKAGGYVSLEEAFGKQPEELSDSGRSLILEARIPVKNFDAFLEQAAAIGTLRNKTKQAEEITDYYYDVEARIKLLEIRYERLETYLKSADDMEDMIALEKEMSDVLYELDSLKGQRKMMDQNVAWANVSIQMKEEVQILSVPASKEDLSGRMGNAFSESWKALGEAMESCAVGFAAAGPVLLVLLVLAVVALAIVLPLVHRRKKKKQQ